MLVGSEFCKSTITNLPSSSFFSSRYARVHGRPRAAAPAQPATAQDGAPATADSPADTQLDLSVTITRLPSGDVNPAVLPALRAWLVGLGSNARGVAALERGNKMENLHVQMVVR